MISLTRRRSPSRGLAEPDVDQRAPADAPVRLQSQWTGGSALATRAATLVLWAALASGPLALAVAVLVLLSLSGPAPTTARPTDDRAGEQAAVEEFAQRFVVLWLQTPQGQEKQLAPFVKVPSLTLAALPSVASDADTAGVLQVGPGLWTITVGVNVTAPPAVDAPATAPVRRFFQVPVRYDVGALVAAALPSPVAAPPIAAAPELAYRYRADLTHPLATSVEDFLAALLTGTGDVTRYVSPGTTIAPVTPAPFTSVVVTDVQVDLDLPANEAAPAPGDQRRVLITARASGGTKQEIGVQYALTLVARAGRWEVKAIDPAPMTAIIPGVSPTG